jgi:hypothetical protein
MARSPWLAFPLGLAMALIGFAACSSDPATSSTGTSSAGGAGGEGGAPAVAVTVTSTATGPMPEAGVPCKNHSYTNIPTGTCDLLQQNCGPGQTCREVSSNGAWSTYCATALGLKGEGESCYVDDECLAKLHCAAGRCAPVCCTPGNAPCLGGICNLEVAIDQFGTLYKRTCHYAKSCTLLTKDACAAGFGCHVEDNVQGLATCTPPTSPGSTDLEQCKYLNDCPDMADCTKTNTGVGICHYYCDLGLADPQAQPVGLGGCPKGQSCFFGSVNGATFSLGVPGVGLCGPSGAGSSSASSSSASASSSSASSSSASSSSASSSSASSSSASSSTSASSSSSSASSSSSSSTGSGAPADAGPG